MKKQTIIIISTIISVALLGIILTQFFWVHNAIQLKRQQFDQMVHIGLKRVVNQLTTLQNDTTISTGCLSEVPASFSSHAKFIHSVSPALLDSMIKTEFGHLEIGQKYFYGIYGKSEGKFILGNFKGYEKEILNTGQGISISCIFQHDQYQLGVYFPQQPKFIFLSMIFYILLSGLFLLIIIAGFWYFIRSLFMQKKLSEIKADFVNNMTHEFKTPISTISVACEMLLQENTDLNPEKIQKYSRIIYDENTRLRNQVEKVLQVATLERGNYQLAIEECHTHEVLINIIEKFQLTVSRKNGNIFSRLNAANSVIKADKGHFTNVILNLLDNAVKYSNRDPEITVSTWSNLSGLFISVEDNGIGMAKEHQSSIFKKFHRISTGNIHDVRGFGLGLYYVKTIVEAHGGNVKVGSEQGKGSKFTLFFPFSITEKEDVNDQ